jgi:putative membrane protein
VHPLAAFALVADHWDHHWWPVWPLFWILLVGLVIWFAVRRRAWRRDPLDGACAVLAERYARGEIEADEYRQRLEGLRTERGRRGER